MVKYIIAHAHNIFQNVPISPSCGNLQFAIEFNAIFWSGSPTFCCTIGFLKFSMLDNFIIFYNCGYTEMLWANPNGGTIKF